MWEKGAIRDRYAVAAPERSNRFRSKRSSADVRLWRNVPVDGDAGAVHLFFNQLQSQPAAL